MESKISIWKDIFGISVRNNDILYMEPKLQPTQNLLVFFGGDIQDTQENMMKDEESKIYIRWSLENTATILSEQFPRHHLFLIRPARMTINSSGVFSCFDNFVPSDNYGTPIFCPMHKALIHLKTLLLCCLKRVKKLELKDFNCDIEATNLSLIGFSKGCAVLNQFLYEFHYYDQSLNDNTDINNFIKLIKDMWWLDGGHNGSKDTWITDQDILESFAKLKINAHIHVTPYQIRDKFRPWIREEENKFNETLQSMGTSVQRVFHFDDKPRSLSAHFNVLTRIG
ncbi:hypothetical protein HN011_005610 [Eciton burchellii]|nr:hypothetical protein HN011_005610 [Eciton burchellii]